MDPYLDNAAAVLGTAPALIPQHVVDTIRDVLPVSAVVSKHVQLRKAGRELKGLSPFNREKTASFYVNDSKRFWHCFSSGQSGDIYAFLVKVEKLTFPEAVRHCAGMAGISIPDSAADRDYASHRVRAGAPIAAEAMAKAAAEREARRRAELAEEAERERKMTNLAKAIARDSRAFAMGDGSPPALFLERRGLVMPDGVSPRVLLHHPRCLFRDDADKETFHPALIGIYRDVLTNDVRAISRRPLTPDGRSVSKPVSLGPTRGCAVMLTAFEDVSYGLHVGEGIETMLAAVALGFTPAWALGGTGNLRNFPVLSGIDALTIVVDHDGSGQAAASECFDCWAAANREVWCVVPDIVGADLNDVVAGGK